MLDGRWQAKCCYLLLTNEKIFLAFRSKRFAFSVKHSAFLPFYFLLFNFYLNNHAKNNLNNWRYLGFWKSDCRKICFK